MSNTPSVNPLKTRFSSDPPTIKLVIVILTLTLIMFNTVIISPNYVSDSYTAGAAPSVLSDVYGSNFHMLLKDIKTSSEAREDVELISINGIPRMLKVGDISSTQIINISIYINNKSVDIITSKYLVSYTGYSTSTKLSLDGAVLNISTYALYGYRTFYVSLCLISGVLTTEGSIILSTEGRYGYVLEEGIPQKVVSIGLGNSSYVLSISSQYQIHVDLLNNSAVAINALLTQGGCLDLFFTFTRGPPSSDFLLEIHRGRDRIIKETEYFFLEILSGYPSMETRNTLVDNLYRYAVFNYINLVHGYPGMNLCSMSPIEIMVIIDFAKVSRYYSYVLKNLAQCTYVNGEWVGDAIKALYVYANAISSSIALEGFDIDSLLNDVLGYVTKMRDSESYSLIELALLRNALSLLMSGDTHVSNLASIVKSKVDAILTNTMYQGNHYILRWERGVVVDISPDNVFEALSVAMMQLPDADKHVGYIMQRLRDVISVGMVTYVEPWSWTSIVALLRYGYLYTAMKLLLECVSSSASTKDIKSPAILSVFIHGFLGLDVSANSISLNPSIPKEVANLHSTIYVCGKEVSVSVVGWGLKSGQIFIDNTPLYGNVIPLDIICRDQVDKIVIPMEVPKMIKTTVRVLIDGSYGRGVFVTATTDVYSVSAVTNNLGEAYLDLPIDSDVWLYVRSTYGDLMIRTHTPSEGMSWIVEVSMPLNLVELLKSSIQNINLTVSKVESELLTIEERIKALERSVANMNTNMTQVISVTNPNVSGGFITIATAAISVTSLLISLALIIYMRKKVSNGVRR